MGKNFSEHVLAVFANHKTSYEQIYQLMKDVALNRDLYDENTGMAITKAQANKKIYEFSLEILGNPDIKDRKEVRRALKKNGYDWFQVIEDVVQDVISIGYGESPWFQDLVETKTIAYGDRQDFRTETDAILAVAEVGESHHDLILQRIGANAPVSIPTKRYAIKIGEDINKYILGQSDWTKMVQAIADAYIRKIQELVSAEIVGLNSKLPSAVVGNGALDSSSKDDFDNIIEKVSAANNGAEVIVMGTKIALKKITALADVNWGSKDQRDAMAQTGTLGIYEGTRLVEIPQRFKDKTLADASKLVDDTKLLILPVLADNLKPVKFVDEADTEIVEITDKGEQSGHWTDEMSYEVQRRFGVGVVLGRILGEWSLPQ